VQPTISAEQAIAVFDGWVRTWKERAPGRVDARLQEMPLPDLKLIAHELGLAFASKPSRKALASGIIGRINVSLMLSQNTNLTSSRAEQNREQTEGSSRETPDEEE
jgi:hypothetical protein